MTYLAEPKHYTAAEFTSLVSHLAWEKGWRPAFPTLHNTAVPSLKTYLGYSDGVRGRWGASLNHYYKGLGWHAGPHLVCTPDGILHLCDLEHDGVSVSCWNHLTIGIEMVGDYATEDFDTGHGAAVRDNAVAAIAALSKRLGWHPDPLVVGRRGLHFHHMCARDHHPCPGKHVSREDVVRRVSAAMAHPPAPVGAA